jgi:squalene-hopene/tetraprenyl-beta-curcumene cyclase
VLPHDPRESTRSSDQPTVVAVEEPDDLAAQLRRRLDRLRDQLLADRGADSHWTGTLSASALSTATAVSALAVLLRHSGPAETIAGFPRSRILDALRRGRAWLDTAQNADGGLGDTDRSPSNIATTYLAVAAWRLSRPWSAEEGTDPPAPLAPPADVEPQEGRAQAWIEAAGGLEGLRRRYGTDKTFVVPIMTNGALAWLFDWRQIPALPFEAAAFPQSMYRLLRLPVVSYAIPALVAIGQARHHFAPSALLPLRWLRSAVRWRTLGVLQRMQPESGGYLEAAPLTSFVVMSLSAIGHHDHPVVRAGVRFLTDSMAEEGSWPIDTNLATWVTSLSIMALRRDPLDKASWFTPQLAEWLLDCQHRQRHPFTGATPGGSP